MRTKIIITIIAIAVITCLHGQNNFYTDEFQKLEPKKKFEAIKIILSNKDSLKSEKIEALYILAKEFAGNKKARKLFKKAKNILAEELSYYSNCLVWREKILQGYLLYILSPKLDVKLISDLMCKVHSVSYADKNSFFEKVREMQKSPDEFLKKTYKKIANMAISESFEVLELEIRGRFLEAQNQRNNYKSKIDKIVFVYQTFEPENNEFKSFLQALE